MENVYRRNVPYRLLVVLALVIALAGIAFLAQRALASPGSGVTPSPIASGDLEDQVSVKFKDEGGFERGFDVDTIMVVKYVIEPGGMFGWHRHAGPVWAVVSEGSLTLYDAHDGTCHSESVAAGTAFLDEGPGHIHNARNEGDTPTVVYATFMLPEGGSTRIDESGPGVCPI